MIEGATCTYFEGSCEDVCCNGCPQEPPTCTYFEGSCEDVCCNGCVQGPALLPSATDVASFMPTDVASFMPTDDNIMHPNHYARWKMEPIEFIAINNLPWWIANVIKYTMRFDAKDGLQDLYKARSYLEMKIREVEGLERFWDKPVAEERKLNHHAA